MQKLEFKLPIHIQGTVVDLETTAFALPGDILTYGFLTGDTITVFQRTDASAQGKLDFEEEMKKWPEQFPRPFYSYNAEFEEKWTGVKFDFDLMKPWRDECSRSEANGLKVKWPKVSELVSAPHDYFAKQKEFLGHQVPLLWQQYAQSGEQDFLKEIVFHNVCDLKREACLLFWKEIYW